ncbi:hypothetical protein DPMN_036041 [Dreissena polymorpha]|uniref:Uncharacterized protein n=1 Tax=Dreissena polymorpha TaxID=45954 RepID=A0A9D4RMN5_DREPO|nr:hypothetical protein DPMN_036041 [Dreissena polymorpha]
MFSYHSFNLQIHKPVGPENATVYWCTVSWETPLYGQLYGVYMFLSILVVPMCLMVFAYSGICRKMWVLHRKRPNIAQHR